VIMEEKDFNIDLIIGVHSIAEVIKNPQRKIVKLIGTTEGIEDLRYRSHLSSELLRSLPQEILSAHAVQEEAKKIFSLLQAEFHRVTSNVFLVANRIPPGDAGEIYQAIEQGKKVKIFCLDQVTDIHNAAAILRTAAFYGLDFLLFAQKGSFTLTPSFYRIASGATEHVRTIRCLGLPKVISKLIENQVHCVGFSEEAVSETTQWAKDQSICLVMGSEEAGISHAVDRLLIHKVQLRPCGSFHCLNVSVAAAIAMERFLGR
jgi:23S rRNA (guanosine2251-2'-O)-methyltransferase